MLFIVLYLCLCIVSTSSPPLTSFFSPTQILSQLIQSLTGEENGNQRRNRQQQQQQQNQQQHTQTGRKTYDGTNKHN